MSFVTHVFSNINYYNLALLENLKPEKSRSVPFQQSPYLSIQFPSDYFIILFLHKPHSSVMPVTSTLNGPTPKVVKALMRTPYSQ